MNRKISIILIILVMVIGLTVPATAVLQEIAYRGQIVAVNQSGGTVTVDAGYQYGCNYSSSVPNCTWDRVTASNLTGTVPDPAAFSVFKAGDQVAATSIGGPGGTWIGLAKIFPTPGIENWLATDIVGDPDSLPVGLASDYYFSYTTAAECGNCTGSVCNARYADITLNSTALVVLTKNLTPGDTVFYNGRNDNSSVSIRFVHGQALSDTCPGKAGMVGLQPVSVFVIHVQQAIAGVPSQAPSQGMTSPVSTVNTPVSPNQSQPVTQTTAQPSNPSPSTTKAPSDLVIPVAALGIGILVMRRR